MNTSPLHILCRKEYLLEPLQAAFPQAIITDSWQDVAAQVVIADPAELTEGNLCGLSMLQLVHSARAGYDAADTAYLRSRGVALCCARGIYSVPIAEDIVCKILTCTTNTWLYNHQKLCREYRSTADRRCLPNMTIGFLGTGSIAQEAAARLRPFGCKVLGYKRTPVEAVPGFDVVCYGEEGLCTVLGSSDIVVIALDLNPSTRHLLDARRIAMMKPGSALINIARGAVVDEAALITALRSGHLRYAGLDVFEVEPLPQDSPLWDMPQVTVTPHASGRCTENHEALAHMVVDNLHRLHGGQPLVNRVF